MNHCTFLIYDLVVVAVSCYYCCKDPPVTLVVCSGQWVWDVNSSQTSMLLSTNSFFMFSVGVLSCRWLTLGNHSKKAGNPLTKPVSVCICMWEISVYPPHSPHPPINFMGNNYEDNPHNNVVKVLRLEFPVLFSATIQKRVVSHLTVFGLV